ncbi:MAG TPA: DNA-processing protein DprA [Jatrophihabitans sp.]|jgi:DNA processing protein
MTAPASTEQDLLAAAYLSRVAEPACLPLWVYVNQLGYREAAAAIRSGDAPEAVRHVTEGRRTSCDPQADLDAAERNGIRLVTPSCPDWPHYGLLSLQLAAGRRVASWRLGDQVRGTARDRGEPLPPLALWVRGSGDLSRAGVRSVAIVGGRAASNYGQHAASELGFGAAQHGIDVVSGGAYGIDAAAHRGALAAGGNTVLISAGGLDRPYPSGNKVIYDRAAESGLLISERPPGSAPHRQRFLSRNRLIAALGSATVVVEAARRSGALNTAGYARDLGRPVLAVPGPITSAMSVGCHALIQRDEQPARLITGVADMLPYCDLTIDDTTEPSLSAGVDDARGGMSSALAIGAATGTPRSRGADYDALDPVAKSVLDGFPSRRTVTEAELSELSGQPIQRVLASLPTLRAAGLITATSEGFRLSGRVAS